MKTKIWSAFLALAILMTTIYTTVSAAATDIYVSPTGNDANACMATEPCKTINKGVSLVQPGGIVHILAGTYSESVSVSKIGTQAQPIRIVGEGAVLSNGGSLAFLVSNSQWISFEGLTIKGYTSTDFELRQSHYLTFKNNSFQYTTMGILIKDSTSHVLVENNEFYQTYPSGSSWSSLKGSIYEGGGVYASSGGAGMYFIRGNNFHDSMNGVYITDDSAGQWMNANVFISGNTFRNIVDDPFEPEGDSFNLHFYNNTLINTHRMASLVPDSACLGPIFVYGNYQQNTLDPTKEAGTGRRNSVIKLDMSSGTCPNGVWVFNNTVNANAAGTNFYGVDLISSTVRNYGMLNNVFVTEKNVYSGTPSFTNSLSDYNISLKPFGYTEPHGLQADPLLNSNGTLQSNSPARGRGTSVTVANYFESSQIVPTGVDVGAFRSFPSVKYALPPGGEPAGFPANIPGWPNTVIVATATPSLVPTFTASPIFTETSPTLTATWTPSPTQTPTSTNTPVASNTPTLTSTASPTAVLPSPTAILPSPTATSIQPTSTLTSLPAFTATALPPSSTPTALPTFTSTSLPPTFTATALPTFTKTPVPASPTFTASPTVTTIAPKIGTVIDDSDPAIQYFQNWQSVSKNKAYQSSYKFSNKTGSFAKLIFTGQSFSLIYTAGKSFGNMEVYVDNQLLTTLNQNMFQNQFQQHWDYPGSLPAGPHELKLVFVGPDSYRASIDAVIVR